MAVTSASTVDPDVEYVGTGNLSGSERYLNRVWDSQVVGSDKSYYWTTFGVDGGGVEYDGPGTWGVHTSDFSFIKL